MGFTVTGRNCANKSRMKSKFIQRVRLGALTRFHRFGFAILRRACGRQ